MRLDEIIREPFEFEWDKGNVNKSVKKHLISNEQSEQVFFNEPLISKDTIHTTKSEIRYLCLGKTDEGTILFISFTIRKNKIRVISARKTSRKERKNYENI